MEVGSTPSAILGLAPYTVLFTTAPGNGCPGGPAYAAEYWDNTDEANATPVLLGDGELKTGIDAALTPTGSPPTTGTISGVLTSRTGVLLSNVCVAAFDATGDGTSFDVGTVSDANGNYTLSNLDPGSYKLIFITNPAELPSHRS